MDEKMDMTSGALTYSRSLSLLKEVNIQCDALKEKTTSLKKLLQEAKEAEQRLQGMEEQKNQALSLLKAIQKEYNEKNWAGAEEQANALFALASSLLNDHPYAVDWKEMALWNLLQIHCKQVESLPYSSENLESLNTLLSEWEALPLGIHDEEAKKEQKEKCFCSVALSMLSASAPKEDLERLNAMLALASRYKKEGLKEDPQVVLAFKCLQDEATSTFNALCYHAVGPQGTYEEAKPLFALRDQLPLNRIDCPLFSTPKTEEEFQLLYFWDRTEKDDDEFFSSHQEEWKNSLAEEDPFTLKFFAHLLVDSRLLDKKREPIYAFFNETPFQIKVLILDLALSEGNSSPLLRPLFLGLFHDRKKQLNLERCAPALLRIQNNVPEESKEEFNKLVEGFFRSPRSHRILEKTSSPDLYFLGKGKTRKKPPVGKKVRNSVASYWSTPAICIFYAFCIVLPCFLFVFSIALLEFNRERIPCEEFYLLIPVGLLLCYVAGVLLAFYGRDERKGWMFSRGFAIDGLWKAILAFLGFLLPQAGLWGSSHRFFLFLLAILDFALSRFAFQEKSKAWRYALFVPFLLIEIASLVLLILVLMGRRA